MKTSDNGLNLIKKWEGCYLQSYKCPAGVWTIGYGTTSYPRGSKVQPEQVISLQAAENYLRFEVDEKAAAVAKLITVALNQNQFDALVSFAYNVGSGALEASTLRKKLNAGDYLGAAEEFMVWNKITKPSGEKVECEGLTNRRRIERALFLSASGAETKFAAAVPKPAAVVLRLGLKDPEVPGGVIYQLQQQLQTLHCYEDGLDGDFGPLTDGAVRKFQAQVFGAGESDGKVGPKTLAAIAKALTEPLTTLQIAQPAILPMGTYLRLTKTNQKDRFGLVVLRLEYIKNGCVAGSINVCSGQPSHQAFRTGLNSASGSMEPLPEGHWHLNNLNWCDGRDNYNGGVFSNGLGPVSLPLDYIGPETTQRRNIEIHPDWNSPGSPGTAGCIGISRANDCQDYKTFVSWLRDTDPRDLYVDWGLGTCKIEQMMPVVATG